MDCLVVSHDATSGELVHFSPNRIRSFSDRLEPDLFASLDGLLERIVPEAEIPQGELRMVIRRLRDGVTSFFRFAGVDRYPPHAPEVEVWTLVDAVYWRRLQESATRDASDVA